jgi:amino acid transporter
MPISFLLACVVIFFTALSYAELSSRYPHSAGEAIYIFKGFNNQKLSIVTGLIIAMSGILSCATIFHFEYVSKLEFHFYLHL